MSANPDFIYLPPMSPYLEIIYQDDDLVVLNKPSGLLSVTGRLIEHRDCLQTRVQRVLPTATIVHRLDMATSGIMLMALNKPAHVSISRQFQQRQIHKRYFARVYGHVAEQQGEVDLPMICDWPNRPKQKVCFEEGKKALTRYEVVSYNDTSTLVELFPITGRSHQLRVHMMSLGHPILGDKLYTDGPAVENVSRLHLHAQSITLAHPVTGEPLNFVAPCPF